MIAPEWLKSRKTVFTWAAVVLLFVLLAVLVSLTCALVVSLFLIVLLLDIDRAIPLAGALILLFVSAFLVALNQKGGAEVLANWAYFFLAIGIILMFIDFVRSGVENEKPPPNEWK